MNKKEMRQRSTMDEFIWIKMFLCLMLMIQIAVSATETSIFIKAGDDVTLPCLNVIDDQKNCDGTTWTFASKNTTAIEVITFGEIVGTNKTMNPARKTESSTTSVTTTAVKDISQDFSVSLRFIIVSVGLAALLITAVTVNIRTRTKGNKTRRIKQGEQNRGRG
ncbi:uncharacterized protein LOC102075743 isoform X2 [Oreochromis niloticus]|uniref:uncharacterized protein LOC102075743 isoform X2 n=1 Tax=Oreochromis niloticus TaxID=8128 RepID=UPI000DF22099|nr:uncharacterized protein LOC102075743 isoform X2 [Oreochromis niloticus]